MSVSDRDLYMDFVIYFCLFVVVFRIQYGAKGTLYSMENCGNVNNCHQLKRLRIQGKLPV